MQNCHHMEYKNKHFLPISLTSVASISSSLGPTGTDMIIQIFFGSMGYYCVQYKVWQVVVLSNSLYDIMYLNYCSFQFRPISQRRKSIFFVCDVEMCGASIKSENFVHTSYQASTIPRTPKIRKASFTKTPKIKLDMSMSN